MPLCVGVYPEQPARVLPVVVHILQAAGIESLLIRPHSNGVANL